jgi:hypothetical protein
MFLILFLQRIIYYFEDYAMNLLFLIFIASSFFYLFFIDDNVGERYEVLHVCISLQKTEICALKYMHTFRGES